MRSKFSELIEQGVASFSYTPIAKEIPEYDAVCRTYNNIFSIPSDTHLSKLEDGRYVITGHMLNDEKKWSSFSHSSYWGAVDFTTSGFWCVNDFLYQFGLCMQPGTLNGDNVRFVVPIPKADDNPPVVPGSYTTSESQIPHPIQEISTTGDINKIKECFKESVTATVKNLNESLYIRGNKWIESDGNIMGFDNNKVYILNVK